MDVKRSSAERRAVPAPGFPGMGSASSCGRVVWDEREIPCRYLLFGVDGRWGLWSVLSEAEREAITLGVQ